MKNNKLIVGSLLFCGAVLSTGVQADTAFKPFLGVSAGTSGYGLQGGLQLRSNLSVRVVMNNLTLDKTLEIDGVDYELDSKLKMPQLLLDFHPFDSGFYISGGLTRNSTTLGGLATLSEPTQIGSVTVNPSDVGGLRASAKYDETAPYVGLGWRSGMASALAWQFEFGLSAMSDPKVTLVEEGSNFVSQADLDAEAETMRLDIEDTLVAYPHLRIGVQYRF